VSVYEWVKHSQVETCSGSYGPWDQVSRASWSSLKNLEKIRTLHALGLVKHGLGRYGLGLGGHSFGTHGLDEHGLGRHGLDEHDLGRHGLDEHDLGRHGLDEDSIGRHGLGLCSVSLDMVFVLVVMVLV